MNAQELRSKYPYIVRWGRMMGSYDYYIDNQCAQAEEDKAPTNAIYKRSDGWRTTDGITNEQTRHTLGLEPLPK
jgi:hypothetical protein